MPHRNCLQHDSDAENLLSKYSHRWKKWKKSMIKSQSALFSQQIFFMCGESVAERREEKIFIFKENLPLKLVAHIFTSTSHMRSILFTISVSIFFLFLVSRKIVLRIARNESEMYDKNVIEKLFSKLIIAKRWWCGSQFSFCFRGARGQRKVSLRTATNICYQRPCQSRPFRLFLPLSQSSRFRPRNIYINSAHGWLNQLTISWHGWRNRRKPFLCLTHSPSVGRTLTWQPALQTFSCVCLSFTLARIKSFLCLFPVLDNAVMRWWYQIMSL